MRVPTSAEAMSGSHHKLMKDDDSFEPALRWWVKIAISRNYSPIVSRLSAGEDGNDGLEPGERIPVFYLMKSVIFRVGSWGTILLPGRYVVVDDKTFNWEIPKSLFRYVRVLCVWRDQENRRWRSIIQPRPYHWTSLLPGETFRVWFREYRINATPASCACQAKNK